MPLRINPRHPIYVITDRTPSKKYSQGVEPQVNKGKDRAVQFT